MNKIRTFKYKTNNNENSIFSKLTKRYSNVKFLRSTSGATTSSGVGSRNASTAPASSTGSYDMTGRESDDLKREIGAPVLISKTTIDADDIQPIIQNEPPLNGPAADSPESSPSPHFNDIKFSFHTPDEVDGNCCADENAYDSPKSTATPLRKNRSKSATNLHKSEIKVYLQRAPSLEIQSNGVHVDNSSYNEMLTHHHHQKYLKNNTSSVLSHGNNSKSSQNPTNRNSGDNSRAMFAKDQHQCDNSTSTAYENRNNLLSLSSPTAHYQANNNCPKTNRDSYGTANTDSLSTNDEMDDFDLKSASFQSLDAHDLFLSIEELNEITQQINDAAEFQHEVDLEYCEHRDKLRPDQRRITLLRNKNHAAINLDKKKEKISHAWSGLKNWIGEERDKIKDVVQKHAAAQRVGGSKNGGGGGGSSSSRISVDKGDEDALSTVGMVSARNSFRRNLSADNADDAVSDRQTGYSNFSRGRSLKSSKSSEERDSVPKFMQTLRRKNSTRVNEMLEVNFTYSFCFVCKFF